MYEAEAWERRNQSQSHKQDQNDPSEGVLQLICFQLQKCWEKDANLAHHTAKDQWPWLLLSV